MDPPIGDLKLSDDPNILVTTEFYEGDRAIFIPSGDNEENPTPLRVRVIKVQSPFYTIALPDGGETNVRFDEGGLYTLDEYEALHAQEEDKSPIAVKSTPCFGGSGGGPFDDLYERRGHITKITVRSGSIIDAIGITYSGNLETTWHGGSGGGEHCLVLRKGEFITEVSVRHGRFVECLAFLTNMDRRLGPWGGGGGVVTGLFLGMHGKEDLLKAPEGYMLVAVHGQKGKFLDAIGFHWGPVTSAVGAGVTTEDLCLRLKKNMLKSTKCFGGKGGEEFDDGHFNIRITSILVYAEENVVNAIAVKYYNGKVVTYGNKGKSKESAISLGQGEYITGVDLRYGEFVQCLTFKTNMGRKFGSCKGGEGDEVALMAPGGYMLVGIYGRSGKYLDSIGFHWSPVPPSL